MDINSGDFEDIKTFVKDELDLKSLCLDGAMFDVCVLEDKQTEKGLLDSDYNADLMNNICRDPRSTAEQATEPEPKKYKKAKPTKEVPTNPTSTTSSITQPSSSNISAPTTPTKTPIPPTIPHLSYLSSSSFEDIARKCSPITEDGLVMKEVIKEGVGAVVGAKANITAHYNAYMEHEDEPFDSTTLRRDPLNYYLGSQTLIEGLEIAIATMKKKECSRFLIRPEYAYGARGCPPRIPANSTCLYIVHLMSFTSCDASADGYFNLPMGQRRRVTFGVMMRALQPVLNKAKRHYQRDEYPLAIQFYSQAQSMLDGQMLKDEEEEMRMKKLLQKVLVDLALCWLRQGLPYRTLHHCSRLLALNHRHVKALYLKGKALKQIGEFERAKCSLERANKEKPGCPEIVSELDVVLKQLKRVKIFVRSGRNCDDHDNENIENIENIENNNNDNSNNNDNNNNNNNNNDAVNNANVKIDSNGKDNINNNHKNIGGDDEDKNKRENSKKKIGGDDVKNKRENPRKICHDDDDKRGNHKKICHDDDENKNSGDDKK